MQFLETWSEVKFKITVTQLLYATLRQSKMHPHTKFEIPAPNSMQFLETRSEVKFKITVTQLLYATLRQSKMHPHTKFEIPISNNIRDILRTQFF